MEQAPRRLHDGTQLDPCEDIASHAAAIDELREAGAAREKLPSLRPQRCEHPPVTHELEPEPVGVEPLGHVAAIDEAQFERAHRPLAADRERTRVEAPYDPAADVENDDDSDPQSEPDVIHAYRARREEHDRRVVPGSGPPAGCRGDAESRLRAGRDPEPPRLQAEPGHSATGGPHAWFAP